jgi:hypothetical protein
MSNEELRRQIYSNLNLKETDDLLDIWQANNRYEWSDEAFEIIRAILQERGTEIPEQGEPVYERNELEQNSPEETFEDDGLDEWEAKALDDESQPEFYDTLEVITLKDNINKTVKAVIAVYALENLLMFNWYRSLVGSYFRDAAYIPLISLISAILVVLGAAISIAIVYFPLKALTHILRILMEMEFRSRKAN